MSPNDRIRHEVRPIAPETLGDMRTLLGAPPEGWCWCVAWEVATWDSWSERTATENRRLRESLWAAGQFHGYVFYLDGQPVGWCRVGPPRTWPKLCNTRGISPTEDAHVFTCFGLDPAHRSKGHAHRFLALVLAAMKSAGVREVLAVPKKIDGRVDDDRVWNGPPALFRRAGFSLVVDQADYQLFRRSL